MKQPTKPEHFVNQMRDAFLGGLLEAAKQTGLKRPSKQTGVVRDIFASLDTYSGITDWKHHDAAVQRITTANKGI